MTDKLNANEFYQVVTPVAWPAKPQYMSITKLINIESCPRRWALSSATYPGLWSGSGYPPVLYEATLIGQIIHLAVEMVSQELYRVGCKSIEDVLFMTALRNLGGYTKIISKCTQNIIEKHSNNPRFFYRRDRITSTLLTKKDHLRETLQILINKLFAEAIFISYQSKSQGYSQLALTNGVYSEVKLTSDKLGWVGIADAIKLDEDICEIVDFKTGNPKPEDELQIKAYSLLWVHDKAVNPSARPANKLTILYTDDELTVPALTQYQINALETEIADRTKKVSQDLEENPPKANPSLQNCQYCSVRHLCKEYWEPKAQQLLLQQRKETEQKNFDVELDILSERGHFIWDVLIVSNLLPNNGKAIFSLENKHAEMGKNLFSGCRVRVINAYIINQMEDDSPLLITLSTQGELFLVPKT